MVLRIILLLIVPYLAYSDPFGKDSDLAVKKRCPECPRSPSLLSVVIAKPLIRFHQVIVSPIDGPRSHFRPSSSQYTLDAMEKYGFIEGFFLGSDRLLRENDDPWIYPNIVLDDGEVFKWDPVH